MTDRSKALHQLVLNYLERHLARSDSVKAFPEDDYIMTRGRRNAWNGLQLEQLAVQIARNMSIDRYLLTKCANIIQRRNSNKNSILKTGNIANLRGRAKSVHDVRHVPIANDGDNAATEQSLVTSAAEQNDNVHDGHDDEMNFDIQPIANDDDNAAIEQSLVTSAAKQNNNGHNGESTNFSVLVVQPSTSNLAGEQTSAPSDNQFQRQKRPIPELISISKSRKRSLATSIIMQRLSQGKYNDIC